jgi:hypothetical protein
MRTTLELDDDVVAAAKELAAIERRSLAPWCLSESGRVAFSRPRSRAA